MHYRGDDQDNQHFRFSFKLDKGKAKGHLAHTSGDTAPFSLTSGIGCDRPVRQPGKHVIVGRPKTTQEAPRAPQLRQTSHGLQHKTTAADARHTSEMIRKPTLRCAITHTCSSRRCKNRETFILSSNQRQNSTRTPQQGKAVQLALLSKAPLHPTYATA